MSAPRTRTRGRGDHQRGAAMVEAAFVTPIVIMMILIVVESGMLLFSNLTVSRAAGDAARVGIVARGADDADARILAAVKKSTVGLKRTQIERIVIWHATYPDSDPPSQCLSNSPAVSIAGLCSVYTAADLDKPYTQLTCGWCPDARVERDLIGVYIKMRYSSVTGLLSTITLTDQKILPIEYEY